MNKVLRVLFTLSILLCGIDKVFSQWRIAEHTILDEDATSFLYKETLELSNGNIIIGGTFTHLNRMGESDKSHHPGLILISSDGEEIIRNEYFIPWYKTLDPPYLFEKNQEVYFLATYAPDHDTDSDNHFMNSDNPPTEAIIGLYKLDSSLNIVEIHEHFFPIDTSEYLEYEYWSIIPNYLCGYINIYSAFEDNGIITGSYTKDVSYSGKPRNDSVFFFKMDFDGNLLLNKGYKSLVNENTGNCYRQQMVKSDNGYIVYYSGTTKENYHSRAEYYDNDFNLIDTREIRMPGHAPHAELAFFNSHYVMRSNHNTTYVLTRSRSLTIPSRDVNVRLYEFDDNLNNSTEELPVLRYIERETPEIDEPARVRGLDMTSEGDILCAYTLNYGSMRQGDSWVIVERLDSDFDTISTLFYDDGKNIHTEVHSIEATSDDGLLLLTHSYYVGNIRDRWSAVIKFPASALGLDNIEEAHAHNLHLAVAYPNPGGEVMNIRTGLRNATLSVYDMQGRIVHQQEITDDVTSIDASQWSSGTYFWKLTVNNEQLKAEEGKWVKD